MIIQVPRGRVTNKAKNCVFGHRWSLEYNSQVQGYSTDLESYLSLQVLKMIDGITPNTSSTDSCIITTPTDITHKRGKTCQTIDHREINQNTCSKDSKKIFFAPSY